MSYWEQRRGNCFVTLDRRGLQVETKRGQIGAREALARRHDFETELEAIRWLRRRKLALSKRGYWPGRHNLSFIEQLANNPNDDGVREVYGDWLLEQGDARGELIGVHVAMAARPEDVSLTATEATILEANQEQLLGVWLEHDVHIEWHLGFCRLVVLPETVLLHEDLAHRIRRMFWHPSYCCLETLHVRLTRPAPIGASEWIRQAWRNTEEHQLPYLVRSAVSHGQAGNLRQVILEVPDAENSEMREIHYGNRSINYLVRSV